MAETRKIVIEIVNKEQAESKKATVVNDDTKTLQANLSALMHPVKTVEDHLLGKSVLLNQAYETAKSGVNQAISLSMNRYYNMREDYIGQNNVNNIMSGVNLVSSFGISVIGGAVAGAKVGGGYGAIAGALIGGIGAGVNTLMGYENRMSSYYSSLNASNYQTQFNRTRAGLTDGGKGTDN